MADEKALAAVLAELKINTTTVQHPAVASVEEHQKVGSLPDGVLVKNLFMKDGKKNQYLILVEASRPNIPFKDMQTAIGAKDMRRDDKLEETLKVKPGSVTPFAVMNDAKHAVIVAVDKKLSVSAKPLLVHPLVNTATCAIAYADLTKFIAKYGNPVKVVDFDAIPAAPAAAAKDAKDEKKKPAKKEEKKDEKKEEKKGQTHETMLGLDAKKGEDFAGWYQQVVTRGEMIDYTDVSGCYVLRPWSYAIWEQIQTFLDTQIKKLGVKNSYFPLFISQRALTTEKDHVEGFAPEVAWVTKSGESELKEPIAVRPTSETVMYQLYSKWIRSHRDLPLKLNQWCNVVRWEFKKATPFIRSREFLWQEGHSAFATKAEADEEVLQILKLYERVYSELLAIPVVPGKKTENEKFAGGLYTTTVEAFIPGVGRGIQGATSHCLGQNFAKMFGIEFENEKAERQRVWQNSWGLTTRTIGVMIMVHSDDSGLVLPPRVAPIQVVIVPVFFKENTKAPLKAQANKIKDELEAVGVRVHVDDRELYTPGWKYNDWELKGVPLRLELGPKDLEAKQVVAKRRNAKDKTPIAWAGLAQKIVSELNAIQDSLLQNASNELKSRTKQVTQWNAFMDALDHRNIALVPWCGNAPCEKNIKTRSGEWAEEQEKKAGAAAESKEVNEQGEQVEKLTGAAKSLCIPFEQPALPEGTVCIGCSTKATCWTLFGRSY